MAWNPKKCHWHAAILYFKILATMQGMPRINIPTKKLKGSIQGMPVHA